MKNIIGAILAIWALVTFVITFLIIFIPSMIAYVIPGRAGQNYFINIARIWMRIWLALVGCPLKVVGKEHFKKGSTYIVTCNHNSLMDVPLSSPFIPGPNKTIAKASFAKVPLFGWFYSKGSVLVDRKNEHSRRQSFDKMKNVLAENIHMCIYPEGTRNRTPEPLKKFHDGAFKLAVETKHAIIPAVIFNTKKVLPPEKTFFFWPARLEMHFLEAIPPGNSVEELREKVFKVMAEYYLTTTSPPSPLHPLRE